MTRAEHRRYQDHYVGRWPREAAVKLQDRVEARTVGIWIRVSTEDQARGESPEHHERRARAYAEVKGWKVAELYDLSGVSGKSVMGHPETQRMLKDLRSERISALIFSKLARLARNTKELLEFSDIFRDCGADLVSLQESIDTTSPAGRLFYTMIAAMAQWEREEIADRIVASIPVRAKLNKPLGGQTSFGYHWKDGKLVPNPEEVPVRKLIYELFKEHRRKKAVARILNERGYRTRTGSKWSDTTIDRLIRDPTAKGVRRANHTQKVGGNYWVPKPESEWVIHPVEAIISEELWTACNAVLDEQRAKRKRLPKAAVQLFAGVVRCTCGNKMYVPSNTPKYVCYRCRNKIPVIDLEGIFHEQLKRFLFSSDDIAVHLREANTMIGEKEEHIRSLETERDRVKREMDKLYQLYLDDGISKAGFAERYHPLDERVHQIEAELPRAQAELDVMRISYLSNDQVIADARDLYSRWPSLPTEEKRQIIEAITESVVIGKEDVAINLIYVPSPSNDGKLATPPHGFIAATSWKRAG